MPHEKILWLKADMVILHVPLLAAARSNMTQVSHRQWGEVPGQGTVDLWVLQSSQVRVEILTLGAIIRSVYSRGKGDLMEDVVLGYDDLEGRWKKKESFYFLLWAIKHRKQHHIAEMVRLLK